MGLFSRISNRAKSPTSPSWALFRPLSSWNIGNTQILGIPSVGRCIDLIAGDVSRVPSCVVGKYDNGYIEVESRLTELLEGSPNNLISGTSYLRKIVNDLLIHGKHLDVITRDGRGNILEITPAEFGTWGYNWDEKAQTLTYQAFGQTFLPSDVLHFRRAERIMFQGEGVLDQFKTTFEMIAGQYTAAKKIFESALPKIKLETDEPISADAVARLQESFRSTHGDASTWSTPVVVSGGMKVGEITTRLDQQQHATLQEFGVADVARAFGVPVTMIDSSSSPTTEDLSAYLEGCLRPLLDLIGAEFEFKTLSSGERLRFKTEQLTRGTASNQAAAARQLIDAGIQTPNEARLSLGMSALDAPGMDEIVISKNYAQMSSTAGDDAGSDASGGGDDA